MMEKSFSGEQGETVELLQPSKSLICRAEGEPEGRGLPNNDVWATGEIVCKSSVSDLLHYVPLSSHVPIRQLLEISASGILGTLTKRLTHL